MIRDEFLLILLVLRGGDGSETEITAATRECEQIVPEIDVVYEAMCWTAAECDLMTLRAVFYYTHNRAPSWSEFQDSAREHIILYGPLMPTKQCAIFRRLLDHDFGQLADALLSVSELQGEAKIADFKAVNPITKGTRTRALLTSAATRQSSWPFTGTLHLDP